MVTGLPRGLVLKSETCEEGETFYTLILGKRLIPWVYEAATLYKDWKSEMPNLELIANKKDKYTRNLYKQELKNWEIVNQNELEVLSKELENLPDYQKEFLIKRIENLPEKIGKTLQDILNKPLFPKNEFDPSQAFGIQKVNQISGLGYRINEPVHKPKRAYFESLIKKASEKMHNKIYKKAYSMTNPFPL